METIIKKIARKNGVSTERVELEMQLAITTAFKNRNKNEHTRAFWNKLSPNGEMPTIENFCQHIKEMTYNTLTK